MMFTFHDIIDLYSEQIYLTLKKFYVSKLVKEILRGKTSDVCIRHLSAR